MNSLAVDLIRISSYGLFGPDDHLDHFSETSGDVTQNHSNGLILVLMWFGKSNQFMFLPESALR